jgi:hypothetical protein
MLVNKECFTKTLLDSGYLSYRLVSFSFTIRNRFPRIPIPLRGLSGFDTLSDDTVIEVTAVSLDIDGYYEAKSFLYVISCLESYNMILGLPWIIKQDARINSPTSECLIMSTNTLVRNQADVLEAENLSLQGSVDYCPVSVKAF